MSVDACIVLTTVGSRADAETLAEKLVGERLAACVQLVDITSVYTWKGVVARDPEVLLVIKAREALWPEVEGFVRANHPYEVPEIVQVPIERAAEAYLRWMADVSR